MNFDFPVEIIRTERSKSASIEIEDDIVKVVVPKTLSDQRIEDLINNRTAWIRQKLKIHIETIRPKPKEYVNGESFTYLGRNYRLKCIRGTTGQVKTQEWVSKCTCSRMRLRECFRAVCATISAWVVSE